MSSPPSSRPSGSSRPTRVAPPAVFPSYAARSLIALAVRSPQLVLSVLPIGAPPAWLKWIVYITLVLNLRSFPGVWHIRLWSVVGRAILRGRAFVPFYRHGRGDGSVTSSKTGRTIRYEALPIGKDIFHEKSWVSLRATPDDCDWMMHLSNSSYFKNLDFARTSLLFPHFYRFYSEGGTLFLGGSTIHYHREIPLGKPYEIRCELASWDDKWLYLVAYFVSPVDPSVRKVRQDAEPTQSGQRSPGISLSRSARDLRKLLSDVTKPEHEVKEKNRQKDQHRQQQRSTVVTPMSRARSGSGSGSYFTSRSTSQPAYAPPPSCTVYATAVSRYTPKFQRKTIPPWLLIASSGFGTWASTRANWDTAEELRERYAQDKRTQPHQQQAQGQSTPAAGAATTASGTSNRTRRGPPQTAFLAAFDPAFSRAEDGADESSKQQSEDKSKAWMRSSAWSLTEWEARRLEGLAYIDKLGGRCLGPDTVANIVAASAAPLP
ncbi:unnamed protein product [Parajaminaea phylloscopi]